MSPDKYTTAPAPRVVLIALSAAGYWSLIYPREGRADAVEEKLRAKGCTRIIAVAKDDVPALEELEEMNTDGVCSAVDCGCTVEPDGTCGEHGNPSWLLALGVI